jgi:UDP-N-acetylglucosamine diphosphorylase / glucose-1-phosphate thymidylyltransferase / UDP-N-acetylgalactosamine diphosphorylase / glucosamine-1-phosphate N-acetyltransferase / galactosamine-1-phosphate N-acetyltransferase
MPTIIFTEENCSRENLFPFTLTRHIPDIRIGALTIREKWERMLKMSSANLWQNNYLDNELSVKTGKQLAGSSYIFISANVLPDAAIIRQVKKLKEGEMLVDTAGIMVAAKFSENNIGRNGKPVFNKKIPVSGEVKRLQYPWQIFQLNDWAIRQDFTLLTAGRKSKAIDATNRVSNKRNIFIESGATISHSIINAETGPVYIGKNAVVQEGCMIRGPFVLGEGALLKMGAKMYGATTLGPYCMGGGEIKNSILMGYSNKGHDGYLGDSVIGEWCNIGAGTSISNIKNTCGEIVFDNGTGKKLPAAGNKGGLLMGDHSKTAINTAFNTGTVVGVCCNIFGAAAVPKYTGNFCWGAAGKVKYELVKAVKDIDNWKKLKGFTVTQADKKILKHIFEQH